MHHRFTLIILGTLVSIYSYCANIPITLIDAEFESARIDSSLAYIEDKNQDLTFDKVAGLNDSLFIRDTIERFHVGYFKKPYWIKLKLFNSLPTDKEIYLEIANTGIYDLQLYYKDDEGRITKKVCGHKYVFSEREIYHKYAVFKLTLSKKEIKSVYLYVDNQGANWAFPLKVWEPDAFATNTYRLQFNHSLYYGFVLLILLINTYFFVRSKRKVVMYYLLYVISLAAIQMNLDGYAFEIFYPNLGEGFLLKFNTLFVMMASIFNIRFFQEYLSSKFYISGYHKYLNLLILMAIIMFPFGLVPSINYYLLFFNSLFALLTSVSVFAGAILTIKKDRVNATYYLVGYFFLLVGVFITMLLIFGVIQNQFLQDYVLKISTSLEIGVLTIAIVNQFQNQQIKTQQLAFERLKKINELTAKAKEELEQKVDERTKELRDEKERVEQKNEQIKKINSSLSLAKQQLEKKNRDIIDSINYAKKIQEAILPSEMVMEANFDDFFVLYKPKDIISGDFYWIKATNKTVLFSVVDCTGHGVPGALMSMMGYDHLNRIVDGLKISTPSKILDELNVSVNNSLREESASITVRDGMDMSLCAINFKEMKMEFAGANNSLYVIREGEIIIYKADTKPIGSYLESEDHPFTNHEIELVKGDIVFLFSDGYTDQFGGPAGKKFKQRAFKELILTHRDKPMSEMGEALDDTIESWRGDLEQIDDMCVLGIRI